ncbi:MAG: AmmeMemoRadiSam system protein B, partial [Nitrospiraceae bacterium]
MIRKPAVAGHFYPSSQDELSHTVETFTDDREDKESAIGIISPHAGLIYSGAVAGAVYSSIKIPHTLILIGPNHTGMGKPVSMMMSGSWKIPTGTLDIDETLA